MSSEKFRYQLRQEAQRWRSEGLINGTQFQQLSDRYRFDHLDTQAKNRFTLVLLGLGSVLIGLGVITFVAANWQDIPRLVRVALLLGTFIGVSGAGFFLWRQPTSEPSQTSPQNWQSQAPQERWQSRLGQMLLLLGGLILGANMALMAQMFHIGGSSYGLFLLWGLGVLVMAYSLRLTSLGTLAIVLIVIGYWHGWMDYMQIGQREDGSLLSFLVQQMPILISVLFLPLAYWCRSKALFTVLAIAVAVSLISNPFNLSSSQSGLFSAVVAVLPAALLWSYDDTLWSRIFRRTAAEPTGERSASLVRPFQPIARRLAIAYLGGAFFWLSFGWIWNDNSWLYILRTPLEWRSQLNVAILGSVAIAQWLYLLRFARTRSGRFYLNVNTSAVLLFIGITALVIFWDIQVQSLPVVAPFVFNVLMAVLAIGVVRESVAIADRSAFWFGIVLLILQIFSRMLEYDTGLLLKALAFVLCGVGVIGAGLWFERYVRTLNPVSANGEE
ncbi:DUF2157 domain-containing protein [Myxacorys almedinensis]|uniref:DUF2157 domain-containing protein n=1 Tax=Myxacorys almedinensis A TaxID=2690445 RepID=A0A8J8CKD2_9CYAN|nr:DUF2157 domain-containing protein [Myxacorys almedinensis]NDJ18486.1 DUF2157 domain-containing protein [Myxacorys almedinensis A]